MKLPARHAVLFIAVLFLIKNINALSEGSGDAPFIGWQGETHRVVDGDRGWVEVISWQPRAMIYHNFISKEEALHIKRLAGPQMRRSTVVGSADGSGVVDDYRTSYGTFIPRLRDPIIEGLALRVAEWVKIPPSHQEDIQVLRYGEGQYYKPHHDVLKDDEAGPRVATVLLYLNEVEAGGETAFPDVTEWAEPGQEEKYGKNFSACAAGKVAFKPKMGDALLFWSILPDGQTLDQKSLHTGCPVVKGVKWTGTVWVHARPFRPDNYKPPSTLQSLVRDPGMCEDYHERCREWAAAGECEKNPTYMVGAENNKGDLGQCRKACNKCTSCPEGDRQCYLENRRALGYLALDIEDWN